MNTRRRRLQRMRRRHRGWKLYRGWLHNDRTGVILTDYKRDVASGRIIEPCLNPLHVSR